MVVRFPMGLAWLSAAAVVILLYFLRRRAREVPVSALFLWERLPKGEVKRLERLWPRIDLLLLLQLLVVAAFALGMADPALIGARPAGATLIVLDGSASMSAQGLADQARAAARQVVDATAGPWAVISWAEPLQVLTPHVESRAAALSAIGRFRPGLSARPPLSGALALLPGDWDRVVVITDDPPKPGAAEVIALPKPGNYAITAFSLRPQPDGSGYEAFVRVANETSRYVDLELSIRAGGTEYLKHLLVSPQAEETFLLPYFGPVGQGLVAELRPTDPFPWDNLRYLAPEGGRVRVRWLGEEDRYVRAALAAVGADLEAEAPPWDLTVAVRTQLPQAPAGAALLIESGTPDVPLGEPMPAGPWRGEDDPLLAHVRPEDWVTSEVYAVDPPPEAKVALWSGPHPAILRWETEAGRRVLIALPLERSNLPITVDFPILVRNALVWLLPWTEGGEHYVGEAIALPAGAELITPEGPVTETWVPDAPGLYELRRGGRTGLIAVNLPPEEAGLGPAARTGSPAGGSARMENPVWPWIAGAALVLLLAEGALALRRG